MSEGSIMALQWAGRSLVLSGLGLIAAALPAVVFLTDPGSDLVPALAWSALVMAGSLLAVASWLVGAGNPAKDAAASGATPVTAPGCR